MVTEVLETADTAILLAKLDVSNHNGPYLSTAGQNWPYWGMFGHLRQCVSLSFKNYAFPQSCSELAISGQS